jgi:hypothetical protein
MKRPNERVEGDSKNSISDGGAPRGIVRPPPPPPPQVYKASCAPGTN